MRTWIALLRGINVGGHRPVAMAALRDMIAAMGFEDAKTLLQSGNVVFRGPAQSAPKLAASLDAAAREHLGVDTRFFVRTAEEWRKIVDANPFEEWARRDPGRLLVAFLEKPATVANVAALRTAITGPELVGGSGREVYIVYPDGAGRSRLTNAIIERTLGSTFTARNWNTVLKLAALAVS